MKIGYLLDTHGGPYNMPTPTGAQVTTFIDHLWREAEAAEQAGFDSLCRGNRGCVAGIRDVVAFRASTVACRPTLAPLAGLKLGVG